MKTLVGVATRGSDIYPKTIQFLFDCHGKKDITVCIMPSPLNVVEGQLKIFQLAWWNKYDYLVMMDSDIVPPAGCIEKMIADDVDIVTAPIWFCNDGELVTNVSYTGELSKAGLVRDVKDSGMEKIKHSSFGCICIKQKVLDAFDKACESPLMWSHMLSQNMSMCYTDAIFHAKARQLGFQAWVDWDIKGTIHYKMCELSTENVNKMRTHVKV